MKKIRCLLKQYALHETKASWVLFILFTLFIFIKVVAFQWLVYRSFPISSLWSDTMYFFTFWLPKITISMFMAWFVFVSKKKWWTVVVLTLIDLWIIANIIYYRANNCILTCASIMMPGNLNGVEDSILLYWSWQVALFPILTIVYALILPLIKKEERKRYAAIGMMCIVLMLHIVQSYTYIKYNQRYVPQALRDMERNDILYYIPFHTHYTNFDEIDRQVGTSISRARTHSIVDYFVTMWVDKLLDINKSVYVDLTDEEFERYNKLLRHPNIEDNRPDYNIVFIMIESLENFFDVTDERGEYILPNLKSLTNTENVLYVPKVKTQVKEGVSSDGQIICQTGLLPLAMGAASMLYGDNVWPNYAHFFECSILSNPWTVNGWNQQVMTHSLGYKKHFVSPKEKFTDEETFSSIIPNLPKNGTSFCYLAITMDTHTPFDRVKTSSLELDAKMPRVLQKYFECLHYTDSVFGAWYEEWMQSSYAENTLLVITADHTIFKDAMLEEFHPYAELAGWSIASGKNYWPLIIQAPNHPLIEGNIQITDVCYQMDIYPTIMHLIGCEDYYWQGLGVNLLDSTARWCRKITEDEAYEISDKMIRANYFKMIEDSILQ